MATEIVCPDCGIRFSEQLQGCPWCGRARPQAVATLPRSAPQPQVAQAAQPPAPWPTKARPTANGSQALRAPLETGHPSPNGHSSPNGGRASPNGNGSAPPRVTRPAAPATTSAAPLPNGPAPAGRQAAAVAAPPARPVLLAPPPPAPVPAPAPVAEPLGRRVKRLGVTSLIVIALLAVGALIAEFAPLGPLAGLGNGGADAVEPAADTDPAGVTQPAPPPPAVTVPTPTAAPTTAAPAPAPAVSGTTIPPFGEPLGIRELTLGVDGIGPLEIGTDGNEVFGRLVASLGQPSEMIGPATSSGEFGTCPGERFRVARFGTLAAINVIDDTGGETFAGYTVDIGLHDGSTPDPAADVRTISGLRAGDTVGDLERIYSNLDVGFQEGPMGPVFELRRPSDGALLLTGPVTSEAADGIVEGIASPSACG